MHMMTRGMRTEANGTAANQQDVSVYMERAQALVPLIESEADEAERARTVTDKVAQALRESGLPWMMVPKIRGGGGLRIADCIEINEIIAAADASVGWILQAYAWGSALHAGFLPQSGAEKLFLRDDPRIVAGSFYPMNRATRVDGGLKIAGRWSFGSGSKHADYIGGGVAICDEQGNPALNPDGSPDIRYAYMKKDQVKLEGNWNVSGLVGTDSQDYSADDVIIPEDMAASVASTAEPFLPDGIYRMGILNFTVAGHASIALGLMRRSLQEVAKLTQGKQRQGYAVPVDEYPVFLSDFAKHEATYQSVRGYVLNTYREAQAYADSEGSLSPELAGRIRQASTWAHQVAEPLVAFARLWAGTKGFREPSPLARIGRDIAVAVTHLQVDPATLTDSAPALLDAWRKI